jgi:long-chain acyl-CoA synthetase
LGFNYDNRGKNSAWYNFQLSIADKLVFSKWRVAFGGNMKVLVSGGAALQPRLGRIFWAANIPVVEGYGLTETSPVISVNRLEKGDLLIGSVGTLLNDVEVKIAEDGEILTKGPNLMKGYYKEDALTNEVIVDGWFHTGDLGELVDGKFLKITGRKKDLFKTSMGKYVAPGHVEDILKESAFIDNIVVVGESQRFAGALVIPNFEHLSMWCRTEAKDCNNTKDPKELVKLPEVRKVILDEINTLNKKLGAHEQVKTIALLSDVWDVESGIMTAKMSIKRMVVNERYKNEIEAMFQ